MADIFLSYSSNDRAVAAKVQSALSASGYSVFWDQETPAGVDWDSWIRQRLSASKMVVVLWSKTAAGSPNVRHEAIVARDSGKLVPVLIENMQPGDFPMGLYLVQAISLVGWRGEAEAGAMQRLLAEAGARVGASAAAMPTTTSPETARDGAPLWRSGGKKRSSIPMGWLAAALLGILLVIALGVFLWSNQREAAWRAVDQSDAHALRAYIADNPGEHREDAEGALVALYDRSFATATAANSVDGWEAFLRDFPGQELCGLRVVVGAPQEDGSWRNVLLRDPRPEWPIIYNAARGVVREENGETLFELSEGRLRRRTAPGSEDILDFDRYALPACADLRQLPAQRL